MATANELHFYSKPFFAAGVLLFINGLAWLIMPIVFDPDVVKDTLFLGFFKDFWYLSAIMFVAGVFGIIVGDKRPRAV